MIRVRTDSVRVIPTLRDSRTKIGQGEFTPTIRGLPHASYGRTPRRIVTHPSVPSPRERRGPGRERRGSSRDYQTPLQGSQGLHVDFPCAMVPLVSKGHCDPDPSGACLPVGGKQSPRRRSRTWCRRNPILHTCALMPHLGVDRGEGLMWSAPTCGFPLQKWKPCPRAIHDGPTKGLHL